MLTFRLKVNSSGKASDSTVKKWTKLPNSELEGWIWDVRVRAVMGVDGKGGN